MSAHPEIARKLHEAALESVALSRRALAAESAIGERPAHDRLALVLAAILALSLIAAVREIMHPRVTKVVSEATSDSGW